MPSEQMGLEGTPEARFLHDMKYSCSLHTSFELCRVVPLHRTTTVLWVFLMVASPQRHSAI